MAAQIAKLSQKYLNVQILSKEINTVSKYRPTNQNYSQNIKNLPNCFEISLNSFKICPKVLIFYIIHTKYGLTVKNKTKIH